jgi:nucleoside-diphosphate-sugar epimerase
MPTKVFITGATGYLGSAIAARFVRAGYEVHGLTRNEEGGRALAALGVKGVLGNLARPESYVAILKNCDAVVHAAADPSNAAAMDQHALEAIKAAAHDGRVRRLLYTSGVWDYGDTAGAVVDESSTMNPLPMVKWRQAHHDVALDLAEQEVSVTILQPVIVYGEARGILGGWFAEARAKKSLSYPGDGTQHWGMIHRDDLAEGYALALEHGAHGERYILADGSDFTVKEIAEAIARASGATTGSWPADDVRAKLGGYGEALLTDTRVSAGKARRELGWVPRHTSFVAEADALYREWQASQKAAVSG